MLIYFPVIFGHDYILFFGLNFHVTCPVLLDCLYYPVLLSRPLTSRITEIPYWCQFTDSSSRMT